MSPDQILVFDVHHLHDTQVECFLHVLLISYILKIKN